MLKRFAALSLCASLAACERAAAPPEIVGDPAPIDALSPEAVAALMARDRSAVVIDVNPRRVYDEGHLPGARWMSSGDVEFDQLPTDRQVPIIFYCYNEICGASHQAASATVARGWTNVARMPAGIIGWKAAGFPVEPAKPPASRRTAARTR